MYNDNLRILILTTNTLHHKYFVKFLKKYFKYIFVIFEKKKTNFFFKTKHIYEIKREKYEKKFFFNNTNYELNNLKMFDNCNTKSSISYIKKLKPNVIISFGIGILKNFFLLSFRNIPIINLHGGNTEEYRGLDSILWSLYHKDFKNLFSTLHFIDDGIDTGRIISKLKIKIDKKTKFEHLRAINTLNCCKLVLNYLTKIINKKKVNFKNQKKTGRYYSAIPECLINYSIDNFNNFKKKNEKKFF